ncbi:proteasome subunit alpha type 6 [Ophiocordyceps camponoti-floridani]|uniref:Proteasome subunit alpha type 6 n=1 Tax=Ophiocordyceps camponoti-floridani TaxID=2030778 RepID=A0A8H4VGL1_9HYPO|nr:proteasome subunit alpha type 6 [Ophiocordyceps camponoti-floridani]
MSSSKSTGAQRIPAWKRLGLKLKQPIAATNDGIPAVGHHPGGAQSTRPTKRRLNAEASLDIKRSRREAKSEIRNAPLTQESKSHVDTPTRNVASSKPAKPKGLKKTDLADNRQEADLAPALEYLRSWKQSHASWKFNKNHQSTLIKHALDPDGIPAADVDTFYAYIRDLKGFVRIRLREAAMEVRTQDRSSTFPTGTADLAAKQVSYEKLLKDLLQTRTSSQKRKEFDEAEFVANSQDFDAVIRRVVKRMRAEMIIEELSDGERTDDSRTTQSSSATVASSDSNIRQNASGAKQTKMDGGIRRRRKLRTNVQDSSSSESEDDDDSDSSSSSSDSSSDDSDDEAEAEPADGYESSSSSSSSSSSEDEAESDDDDDGSDDD